MYLGTRYDFTATLTIDHSIKVCPGTCLLDKGDVEV